jgi:hypothetical protein
MKNSGNPIVMVLFLCLIASTFSCKESSKQPGLKYDHIILFTNNPALKDSLDLLFTPAEKLTTEHPSQGTIGYYYLFYNTYLELLYLKDSAVVLRNKSNFGSDYLSRWDQQNEVCPVGFGLSLTPWDSIGLNENFKVYQSDDAPKGEYYMMSKYNNALTDPLLYVSLPHRRYQPVKSLDDIKHKPPEIQNDLRNYLSHSSGVKNLIQINYAYPRKSKDAGNLRLLNDISTIEMKPADQPSLTLCFDHEEHKKQMKLPLTNQFNLIIQY